MFTVENVDKTVMGADCREISLSLDRRGDISPIWWALGMLRDRVKEAEENGQATLYSSDEIQDVRLKLNLPFCETGMMTEYDDEGNIVFEGKINEETSRSKEDPGEARLTFAEAGVVLAGLWTWIDEVSSPNYTPAEPLNAIGREDLAALNEAADQFAAALAPQKVLATV